MLGSFFKKYRLFFFHLSFWLVYISFFLYEIGPRHPNEKIDWIRVSLIAITHIFFTATITYFNYLYLVPKYLIQKKLGLYFLFFIISFLLILSLNISSSFLINDWLKHFPEHFSASRFIVLVGANMLFIVIFVSSLGFAFERFELESKQKALENERLSAEINFLKAQINPHFLFNTLNNLYYLAYTQSENTTEVISKLSQMMRYMIYESNHDRVRLSQEIEYMENYISLEKLRLNNNIPIHFHIHGTHREVMVAPLILITFLENAFKHGAGNNLSDAWIEIGLEIQEHSILFQIKNSKPEKMKIIQPEKSGIGLQNVKRRLELTYPEKYKLLTQDEPQFYSIELTLDLN
jgi:sensor histidine kinase YesM